MGGESHRDNKHEAEQAARNCALAPALEHGDRSNEEKQDCTYGNSLMPHEAAPSNAECYGFEA